MFSGATAMDIDVQELIQNFPYTMYPQRIIVYEKVVERVGKIIIPETSQESEMKTNEGYVIAIGEGVTFCLPGAIVLYGRYSGAWQIINDRRYRIMNEEDIIALRKVA